VRFRFAVVSFAAVLGSCDCGGKAVLNESRSVITLKSNELDFGPVTELTQKELTVNVENGGAAAMQLSVELEAGSSADFTLGALPSLSLPAGAHVDIPVVFSPKGSGDDVGRLVFTSDDPQQAPLHVNLHGGPIHGTLRFSPDPVDFTPATRPLETRLATLENSGGATLEVRAVGVAVGGNPDFSVTPPMLPLSILPAGRVAVEVAYARSARATEGALEVHSSDPDAGVRRLRLLPDPPERCSNASDDDGDGLTDFPDDPGCDSAIDEDEFNPPQCQNGATQPCGTDLGACTFGVRTCSSSLWSACDGGVKPAPETCNGIDDDCDGVTDQAITETCMHNGCLGSRDCIADAGVAGGAYTACAAASTASEVCDGRDNDCDGTTDEGITQSCTVNTCAGTRMCIAGGMGTFDACLATNPQPEQCNGLDDDCNGTVDDGIMQVTCGVGACRRNGAGCVNGMPQMCTPGTPVAESCNAIDDDCNGMVDDGLANATCGAGACFRSVPSCVGGVAQPCTPGNPAAELCNSVDDDCDGTVDDGNPGGGAACSTGQPGVCAAGTVQCSGGALGCAGNVMPSAERCNGLDDDCDVSVDEGNPEGGAACSTGQAGVCAAGTLTCSGGMLSCARNANPSLEVCNGLDDNCAGGVDEGNPGGGASCMTGQAGVCAAGTMICTGGAVQCVRNLAPSAEVCDGLDNDCNDGVDEGNPGGGAACSTGQAGVCGAGTVSCVGGTLTCVRNVAPAPEVCNGLDDNCAGGVDEGNPGGGAGCSTGQSGVCAQGTMTCAAGMLSCARNVNPSAEVCNGLDDDCDATTDEGSPGGGAACSTGQAGVCAPGTATCTGGSVQCIRNVNPSAEVCNGQDDNCNGSTDEGNPGGGAGCSTGQSGVCGPGTQTCTGGSLQCLRNVNPSAEACNGLDDDCDASTDEGNPGGGAACSTGQPGVCSPGTQTCTAGTLQCIRNVNPSAELCNGQDDNCNGTTDEGNPGGGAACSTGQPGVCSAGTQTCTMGSVQCVRNVNPSAEVCNGLDDDCDASTDEGNPGGGAACMTGQPGICAAGTQTCTMGSVQCIRNQNPAASETCGNGLDDDCDGSTDEGCSSCDPNGTFQRDGGSMIYTCCGGLVNVNINRFVVSANGTVITPQTTQPGTTLNGGPATTCPSGPLRGRRQLGTMPSILECVEVYFLDAGFVGPNEFRGQYTITFTGAACTSFLCGGDPCFNQSWPVQAFR